MVKTRQKHLPKLLRQKKHLPLPLAVAVALRLNQPEKGRGLRPPFLL